MSVGRLWEAAAFRAATSAAIGTAFDCGLCGSRFTHGDRVCDECPLAAGCHLVRCPSCGYQFPRESRLGALRRLWARGRKR
jgi:hypothetical protein